MLSPEPPEEIEAKIFVCDCEDWMRTACASEGYYKEHEGKRYCVFHYPRTEKTDDFKLVFEKKVEAEDFDFSGVWFPDYVDFERSHFNTAANFSSATFSKAADFSSATFGAEADFSSAIFSAYAKFSGATFSGIAGFTDTTFSADTDFSAATFIGATDFIRTTFSAIADFRRATFSAIAGFTDVTFGKATDFRSATFSMYADFNRAKFSATAIFYAATFSSIADFRRATFSSIAGFTDVIFCKETDFRSATFSMYADFNRAKFSAITNFIEVIFSADADFSRTTFGAEADFSIATFSAIAHFVEATFSADVSFETATFSKDANFSQATFSATADFSFAIFSMDVNFGHTTFNNVALFDVATFKAYVIFAGASKKRTFGDHTQLSFKFARIEKPERICFHTLHLRPNWFINIDPRKFDFIDIEFIKHRILPARYSDLKAELKSLEKSGVSAPHRLLAIAYRQLAVNAEENHRYHQASQLRFRAFEARQIERYYGIAPWRLDWWYLVASGYGENVRQAFIVFLLLLSSFTVGYKRYTEFEPCKVIPKPAEEQPCKLGWRDASLYSISVSLWQKPDPKPLNPTGKMLVVLQSLLGPTQAALLALAVRRRFMR